MLTTSHVTADDDLNWRATNREAVQRFGRPFARISWGAIFAGSVVALAVQLVLTLIGGAVGLATLNPATGQSPSGTTLGIGAAIWVIISSLISLFAGGYVAGRLGGTFNGWLHGLATWATVTTFTIVLLATAAGGLVGAASGLGAFAVTNSDKMSGAQLPPAVQQGVNQLRQTANQTAAQAQQTVPQQRQAEARELGERAAKGGAAGTGAAAIALILGGVAAAMGGKLGRRSSPFVETEAEEEEQQETESAVGKWPPA